MRLRERIAYGSGGGAPAGASVMILKSSCTLLANCAREQVAKYIHRRPRLLPLPHPCRLSPAVNVELHFEHHVEPGQQALSRRDRRNRRLLPPWFSIVNRLVDAAEARIDSFASYRMRAEFGLFALGSRECLQNSKRRLKFLP